MPPSDGPSDRPSQSDRPPESPREDRPPARESVPRNITELVEPLFVFLCRVHRRKQAGEDLSYHKLRQETEQVISRVEKSAKASGHLRSQFKKLSGPIDWMFDYWFASSGVFPSVKIEWDDNRLSKEVESAEEGIIIGDEAFFVELDETLRASETDDEAIERLVFFYQSIGSGMRGQFHEPSEDNDCLLYTSDAADE